jgi:hypothetical protein
MVRIYFCLFSLDQHPICSDVDGHRLRVEHVRGRGHRREERGRGGGMYVGLFFSLLVNVFLQGPTSS